MKGECLRRVVFITNLDVLGGTENNLVSLVAHPEFNKDFEIFIFSGTPPHKTIISRLSYSNVKIIQYNSFCGIRIPRVCRGINFKRQIKGLNPNVIIFWNHLAKFSQLEICKELQIKTIFFERGTGWTSHDPLVMRQFLHSVDRVVANTFAGKRRLEEIWGYEGQCQILPNALRPEIYKAEIPSKCLPEDRPIRIGIAARLTAYKGVASSILAIRELQNEGLEAELHIAGDGEERNVLNSLARSLNVHAVFHGTLNDMASFYQHIDILIVPSIREPFGTVAIEAQYLGCPVLCTCVDGLPEVVLEGQTGILIEPDWDIEKYAAYTRKMTNIPEQVYQPGSDKFREPKALDPEKIALKIVELIKKKHAFEEMSMRAAIFARNNFNFEVYIQKFKNLLKNVD